MKWNVILVLGLFMVLQSAFAQNYRYGRVSKEEIEEKQHPQYPEADAAILYREVKTNFHYNVDVGFTLVTEVFERIKIYNQKGMDWATKRIEINKTEGSYEEVKNEKGATYNLDNGKVVSERLRSNGIFKTQKHRYQDELTLTLPNVKEGSVIEFSYIIYSPYVRYIDYYDLQDEIPINKVNMQIVIPEYFEYNLHQRGWLNIPVTSTKTDRKIYFKVRNNLQNDSGFTEKRFTEREVDFIENNYLIEMENVPPMEKEPYAINSSHYKSALSFELAYAKFPGSTGENYVMSWDAVSKSLNDRASLGGELKKSGYFKSDLDALLAQSTDTPSKLVNIYEFVKNKMTHNGYIAIGSYDGLAQAYKQNTGTNADINLILIAMLQNAGIEAYPILISTKSNGIPLFPTINGFDYLIAGAMVNGQLVLMDASKKYLAPQMLHPEIINWQGRLIRSNGTSEWVQLYNSQEQARLNVLVNAQIDASHTLKGSVKSQRTGHFGYLYREEYGSINKDNRMAMIDRLYQIESENLEVENVNNVYQNLVESYDFSCDNLVEEIADKLYLNPILFFTEKENIFQAEKRIYPVDYSFARDYRYMVNIALPEGYRVESLPSNITLQMPGNYGTFRFLISDQGNQIQVSLQQTINQSLIPTEIYEDLKMFYQTYIDKMNEKIVLAKI